MPEILTPHNESLMPLKLGPPYRVPEKAYPLYGLAYKDEFTANQAYLAEWGVQGTPEQIAVIPKALAEAGFADFNALLQQATAKRVAELVQVNPSLRSPRIADIGAGEGDSGLVTAKSLPIDVLKRAEFVLIDPAEKSLKTARQKMEAARINHTILTGLDTEVLKGIPDETFDILTGVASVHHHARIPFDEYARVLRKDGFAIFADWHHDLWNHPARVLSFLNRFDWPNKKGGLANWIETYPQSLNNPDASIKINSRELIAREQITRFWLQLAGVNIIWLLEGHRLVDEYVESLQSAGFLVSSPHQLLPNSSLLMVTCAKKG